MQKKSRILIVNAIRQYLASFSPFLKTFSNNSHQNFQQKDP